MFEKIKEHYKYQKEVLNDIRYKYNCVFIPAVGVFIVLDLIVSLIIFLSWKSSYLFLVIALLSLLLFAFISIFIVGIVVRNKEVGIEAEKLEKFFESSLKNTPDLEYVLPRGDTLGVVNLTFKEKGFSIEDLE